MGVTYEEYLDLVKEVERHNELYYGKNTPEVSDEEFDFLLKKLEKIEETHPEWKITSSPTQRVGSSAAEKRQTEKHIAPMLSLANSYSREDIELFVKRIEKTTIQDLSFFCELKMDGIAISIQYINGVYTRALTRGNGVEGEVITENARTILNLPLKLKGKYPNLVEVRGEVYMEKENFHHLNAFRQEEGLPLFANPRNATGGALKLLNAQETAERGLKVIAYGIKSFDLALSSQQEEYLLLKSWGLPVLEEVTLTHSIDEIIFYTEEVHKKRPHLPFEIDGVVIKVNSKHLQEDLGSTNKTPRWAIAYKFQAEKAITTLESVTWQVGKTGIVTPVAELKPVFLAGSKISRASLYNIAELERLHLEIGCEVEIEKGGDVIPKVVRKVSSGKTAVAIPMTCPSCGHALVSEEGYVALFCKQGLSCPDIRKSRYAYALSKECLNVEGCGEKVVAKLLSEGLVKELKDFFFLKKEDLLTLEGFKEKSVGNLLNSLEKAKKVPLAQFILSAQIPHIGKKMAHDLASYFQSWEEFKKAGEYELDSIEGIGGITKKSIVTFLSNSREFNEIEGLLLAGVEPFFEKISEGKLLGKSFVITGTFSQTRPEIANKIRSLGGVVKDTVSKNIDYVAVGKDPGSKVEKAKKLGIPFLDEAGLVDLLRN